MGLSSSAYEALSVLKSGHRIFVHGGAATPLALLRALSDRAAGLEDLEILHLHTMGPAYDASKLLRDSLRVTNLFVGENFRPHFDMDRIDYLPCFLSEIPRLIRSGRKAIDVALISLSPPNAQGLCSLGTSIDITRAAIDSATIVIAQINRQMPRSHGDTEISLADVDAWIEIDEALPEPRAAHIDDDEMAIGALIAELIDDGSTLQAGIGSIPDAALAALKNHRHLGLHTEMWSDHALDLIECGAIDNSRKIVHPGRSVAAFCIGSQRVYRALNENPAFAMLPADFVNDVRQISRNPKVVAINSAVEIDLTGQVCSDSVGHRLISGVGGQLDFIRGAALSEGGKPIIAVKSCTADGQSKIVSALKSGAGVVTTRAHVHYVVTEFGVADLYGKTLHERAKALIQIAHPMHRETLDRQWHENARKPCLS